MFIINLQPTKTSLVVRFFSTFHINIKKKKIQ